MTLAEQFIELRKLTQSELELELASIRNHIATASYGNFELMYERAIEEELDRRFPV